MNGSIPQDIQNACAVLGWTPLSMTRCYGREAVLVRDGSYITEPYTRERILQEAKSLVDSGRGRGFSPVSARPLGKGA